MKEGAAESHGVVFRCEGDFLTAKLPSKWQKLYYHQPRLEWDEKFERECWTYTRYRHNVGTRVKAYGGLLTENVVQALARGLLVSSMLRLEKDERPVVLTVHDEIVCEVPEASADLKRFESLMGARPEWAQKLKILVAV